MSSYSSFLWHILMLDPNLGLPFDNMQIRTDACTHSHIHTHVRVHARALSLFRSYIKIAHADSTKTEIRSSSVVDQQASPSDDTF